PGAARARGTSRSPSRRGRAATRSARRSPWRASAARRNTAGCWRRAPMPKRVLVVDDSASVRQVQKVVLSAAGYEVVEAVDGRDALAKLAGRSIHLILTDLNMPNLDGLGLIRAVRSDALHRLTPVVMVTTESQGEKKQEGKAAGATGWIVKPFSPEQLVAVVKKVAGAAAP